MANKRYGTPIKIFTKKEYQNWSDKIWEKTTEKGPDFLKDKENPFTNFMRGIAELMEYSIWEAPELKAVIKDPEDGPKPVMYWFDQNKKIKEK